MADRTFDDSLPTRPSGEDEPRGSNGERPEQTFAHDNPMPDADAADLPHKDHVSFRRPQEKQPQRLGRRAAIVFAGIAVLAVLVGVTVLFVQNLPASITLNGTSVDVGGSKTLADALDIDGISPIPGDLVAVDGSVLEKGKGEPFRATINGDATTDVNAKLASGDVVELLDGNPIEEPSETTEEPIPYTYDVQGNGPIHLIEGVGVDGVKRTKTGSISGTTAAEVAQEPVNVTRRNVSPSVGDDKVVALTFDDGPWPDSTAAVLDVLAENDAKATFFTVGNLIDGERADLVKRAASEGHQICSHSFDHAAGDGQGVNLGYMKPEDQVDEVQKGYDAIKATLGTEASHVFRTPGGNYGEDVMRNIGPLISAEIGWNIDSQDWRRPGVGAIINQIETAWPGAIVLLHDGGGNRSQTVAAIKEAIPYLKSQGYRFVTMDELLSYPLS